MNILRKAMAKEAAELKPFLDDVYGAILRFQRQRTAANEFRLREATDPAVTQLMVFRPYMPVYKQVFFGLLEEQWRAMPAGDLIMLFDHCVNIMHLRLSRDVPEGEAQQPWSRELLLALDRRRAFPHIRAADGDYLVSGIGASPGRAGGPARVLRDGGELGELRDGDILVCPMATPDRVGNFRRIRALVTDQGGMLCHAAVIAREFGLPCVTGCGDATERIRTGYQIEVDGDLGLITRPGTEIAQ
ncbi:MAG: PEP-utilizing enzyme [Bacillota bacterium]|nr:PEP-utilizing enzyme [Bacillota bacterium]